MGQNRPVNAHPQSLDLQAPPPTREPVRTWANLVTSVRTVAAVLLSVASLSTRSVALLVAAYGIYWCGDILDGFLARRLGQETRLGAVFDIISDRACTAVAAGAFIVWRPHTWWVLALFLVSFMVLDTLLSLSFLWWPLVSPNYFAAVDATVWRLNWSIPAKAINTSAVVLLMLLGWLWVGATLVVALAAVKVWSAQRVLSLREAGLAGPPL